MLDDVPLGHAINSACHAAVSCCERYREDPLVKTWLKDSFKKVTCKVNKEQALKCIARNTECVFIEESALDGKLTAIAFKPQEQYDEVFKGLELYS